MNSLGSIGSLQMFDIYDHGVPNMERFGIYARGYCDLSNICVVLASRNYDGSLTPLRDHMLWLGHGVACPGDWIIVYTAAGTTTVAPYGPPHADGYQPRVFAIHWGKDHTVFQNRGIVPMLWQVSAVEAPPLPTPQYQGLSGLDKPRIG